MRKALKWLAVLVVVVLMGVYGVFFWCSEGLNRIDGTGRVRLFAEERRIELPWYLKGSDMWAAKSGVDADGSEYTLFCYDPHPTLFECELNCVVNWTDGTSILYLGESRAMDEMYNDFAHVEWGELKTVG